MNRRVALAPEPEPGAAARARTGAEPGAARTSAEPGAARDEGLRLFVMDDSRTFGEALARALQLPASAHEERAFEDGEHKSRPLVSVRGADVYVLQSLYGDPLHSGNDKLCRLLFFIGALKDAAAARVTAVVPYLAYARKDRQTKPRDPVTTRYLAALFEAVGTDVVMTLDVHNLSAFQNAFRCRTEHLEANSLFVEYAAAHFGAQPLVVVAPDAGATKRAEHFRLALAQVLGRPVGAAFAEKFRSEGRLSGELLAGDVEGRVALIVDDLVSTGGTLARTAALCRRHGAQQVIAIATHGLFMGEASRTLAGSAIDRIVIADSVPPFRLENNAARDKLVVLSAAPLFAAAIRHAHAGARSRAPAG
jgi:ribose-phosphate pyrophosphokinase